MMAAASPSPAGCSASGLSGRRTEEISDLIDLFSKMQYRAKEVTARVEAIETRCLELFARDYKYSIIHNANGEVCGHYPRQIVFLEYECTDVERDRFESTVQISKLQDLVNRSKLARCRGRFVCPVILYNGKHICRSSTLAGWGELYGRTGYNYIFSGGTDDTWTESEEVPEDDSAVRNGDSQLFDKVRGHDIKLLRYLSVRSICDLMVENKKVKFGLNVTSSEKADKAQRYADFTLLSVPYPGCEFFKDYKDRDYTAEGLVFNWNQDYVDAPLTIPMCFTQNLNIDWTRYQSWDLVEQTQNYLKLLLHIINSDDESGLLVHCISGWDRTPLFVSLLRLSLWADGAVHASLEPAEILYLTIAYDWFLFGHMLPDRLSKGEEIFFFCFNFLKHIVSEKFSAVKKQRRKNSHFKDSDFSVEDLCQLKSKDRGSVTSLSSDFSLITEEVGGASSLTNDTVDLFTSQPQASSWRKGTTSSPQMVVWSKPLPLEEHLSHPLSEARSSSSSSSNQSEHGITRTGSSPLAVPGRRLAADYTRSGSSLSTEYGSWQIVSGCGSIHDHAHFPPPLASASSTSSAVAAAYDSPLPFSFQDEGPSGRMCPFPSQRQARLEAVREVFLAAYSSTVGLKSSVPSPSGAITGLLEQFARGVGLRGTNAIV
ncbi:myotubularin-related protein 14 isoform X1 [Sebastes umbrosus]|uniref:myotubularin-related protein 14 isoform X1 n=1 Tax=Sebastes umbrosus TaxID=72105 RepID=UPI00189C7842|nr:myotubularin-related protein 14 isoform X1 [Sebastes umbrosus]XP_037622301.1 myotubularin-related protein 14 isoform X1 [Sebastes umbrosus]XP_037622309.1 myotubularin-related protein 14 isoform X1 [Sebastes umbrosus]XP_037622317.1 myotubularin-related protein 14 isoform X1 [Sebastes umbrosus]XP_037622325.1 myotubularin-related protein 14 isoform X1 [Sebastes umbrosus]